MHINTLDYIQEHMIFLDCLSQFSKFFESKKFQIMVSITFYFGINY